MKYPLSLSVAVASAFLALGCLPVEELDTDSSGDDTDDSSNFDASGHWRFTVDGSERFNGVVTDNGSLLILTDEDMLLGASDTVVTSGDLISVSALYCDFASVCAIATGNWTATSDTQMSGRLSTDAANVLVQAERDTASEVDLTIADIAGTWTEIVAPNNYYDISVTGSVSGSVDGCDVAGSMAVMEPNVFSVGLTLTCNTDDKYIVQGLAFRDKDGNLQIGARNSNLFYLWGELAKTP